MQGINPPTPAQLLAIDQQPLLKLEIWVGAAWINLCDLGGKNYVQDISISLGGASMTPLPVEGTWSATIFNKDGVFHHDHLTSAYKDYLKTERRVKISVGAIYGGVPIYWPRIIGYMNVPVFSGPDINVAISGGDYMKRLKETELRRPNNYWGSSATYNSIASDGLSGTEIYAELDAMEIGAGEADNVDDWPDTDCTFVSFNDVGDPSQPSGFVGRLTAMTGTQGHAKNLNIGNAVVGNHYKVTFQMRAVGEDGTYNSRVSIKQSGNLCEMGTYYPTDTWKEEELYFTALENGAIEMWVFSRLAIADLRIDQISVQGFTPYWERYYELNGGFGVPATGPYYVTLDSGDGAGAVPCWQGEGDEDWKYAEVGESGADPPYHPAKIVFFNINKTVPSGNVAPVPANNLVIYYFTSTPIEDVVARLLYYAGVCDPTTDAPYANEAAAKARIVAQAEYVFPAIDVDKVWFEAGTNCLSAITKICELSDYRFYFKYDGSPIFRPKPTWVGADFTFTDPKHVATFSTYQDQNEIKNRIVIKGIKQADAWNKDETMPSYLTGEASDGPSIAAYGERTMTINNHLFQVQATLDAMCVTLKDEYHEPKWYSDLGIPFNPVPLELGDNIQWEEHFSPTLDKTRTGIIRDIKIDNFSTTYKCVLT